MKNIIPEFIAQRSQLGEKEGSFDGIALFLDISGFTTMTEELMKGGKLGAESLSQIMNSLFRPLIAAIYGRGGFVSLFAGDAFTAIFPVENKAAKKSKDALQAAVEIQNIMQEEGLCRTRHGYFSLSIKVGLAFGPIQWGILSDTEGKQCFYFRGPAIDGCALAEQQARQGDIVLEKSLLASLDDSVKRKEISKKYFLLEEEGSKPAQEYSKDLSSTSPKVSIKSHILERFASRELLSTEQKGEFRDIASVFLSYQGEPSKKELGEFIDEIMKQRKGMGAFFNSLDFGDKGCAVLVLFGAPVAHEDDYARAASFSLEISAKFGTKARIGIAYGTAFAGFIGSELRTAYTALGKVINLSARLMMSAPWGHIWLIENMKAHLEKQEIFEIELAGEEHFKGIAQPLKVYQLKGLRRRSFVSFEQIDFVGREKEMQGIEEELKKTQKQKKGLVAYYYGRPGSGKSRMLHEIYKKNKKDYEFHFIHADHLFPKSFNPFSRYLKSYLELPEEDSAVAMQKIQAKVEALSQSLSHLSSPQVQGLLIQLKQKVSYIGAILEVQSLKPKRQELGEQAYFSNIIEAVSAFFTLCSLSRPTIFVAEDLHLFDKDSLCILEALSNASPSFPLHVLISSRYTDEGEKPSLQLHKSARVITETLDRLSDPSVEKLVSACLGREASPSLLRFIREKTDANAFFIEQYCLYLQNEDLLLETEKGMELKKGSQNLPGGINALLLARIDRLSPRLREAAQLLSVLGLYFRVEVFQELYKEKGGGEAQARLEEGIREQIWEDCGKGEYRFKDDLLRISAYEMQLRAPLRAMHLKAAKAIEKLFPKNPNYDPEIAFHYENAEEVDLARQYYYNAVSQAEEYYKLNKALEYYDRLLPIARHEKEKNALLEKKGEFLDLSGRWDEGISLFSSLYKEDLKSPSHSKEKLARYLAKIGDFYQKKGNHPKAIENLNESIKLSQKVKDQRTLGLASRLLGRTFWRLGKYAEAQKILEKGLLADEKSGDKRGIGMNLYYTGRLVP